MSYSPYSNGGGHRLVESIRGIKFGYPFYLPSVRSNSLVSFVTYRRALEIRIGHFLAPPFWRGPFGVA
ncbi:hypothetical protein SK128_023919 [Halocaridina rubra]|uniref:Uncharacterized protein n=1 Tax=Halocaridina rubra TaxID=373956 RepID=A0AAN8WIQ4_HALRR